MGVEDAGYYHTDVAAPDPYKLRLQREERIRSEAEQQQRECIAKALEQEAEGLAALAREGRGDPVVLRANSIYALDVVARIEAGTFPPKGVVSKMSASKHYTEEYRDLERVEAALRRSPIHADMEVGRILLERWLLAGASYGLIADTEEYLRATDAQWLFTVPPMATTPGRRPTFGVAAGGPLHPQETLEQVHFSDPQGDGTGP